MKNRPSSYRMFRFLLMLLLAISRPASSAFPLPKTPSSTPCPRCSHRLSVPPPPPALHGEGDRFLCRWEVRPDNPYLARFVTCPNCGLTLLPSDLHLNNLPVLIASIPQRPVHTPMERLARALQFYQNPALPFKISLRGLWNIICALHYHALHYPDPSWNQQVHTLWKEIRTMGMERWPVWRWYESLALAFQQHARRFHDPVAAALATDFFRKIGYLQKAKHWLEFAKMTATNPVMKPWLQNEQQLLAMEASARNGLLNRIQKRVQTRSLCPWDAQSVLYIGIATAYDFRRRDLFIQWTENLRKCPSIDPVLLTNALVPLIRNAWLNDPDLRTRLHPFLFITARSEPYHEAD